MGQPFQAAARLESLTYVAVVAIVSPIPAHEYPGIAQADSGRNHAKQGLTEFDSLTILDQDLGDRSRDARRDIGKTFIASMMQTIVSGWTTEPTETNGGASGALEA